MRVVESNSDHDTPTGQYEFVAFIPPDKEQTELEAAWTIAAILLGRPERRDRPGAASMTHDFDIEVPTRGTIALEITTSVFSEFAAFWRGLANTTFDTEALQNSWSISVTPPSEGSNTPSVKRIRNELLSLLIRVEAHLPLGVIDVMWADDAFHDTDAIGAIHGLRSLGVTTANPLPRFGSDRRQVAIGTSGFRRHTSMTQVIEERVRDNSAKLARAKAAEKHLFVWITDSDIGNSVTMALDQLPDEGPESMDGIDVVWMGLWSPGFSSESWAQRLWSFSLVQGWTAHRIPLVRTYAYQYLSALPE